ncbi:Sensor histidine kinase WalK [bioreactor metagenome]|uniref:histidine kinase n=1 Tax=bioreactor metagenome TaxID=1076179 RepID=A0A645F8Q7_9ZZZZ
MLSILAAEKGVELRREINQDATVLCTGDGLFQIVYNLVENGIKYNRDGGFVTVTLGESDGAARITVADDGIGVPENELTKIFDRFYRVDKARSRAAGGTGLGLAIVRDTALLHGGSVTAAPREGGGTVFTVTLRLAGKGGEAQ